MAFHRCRNLFSLQQNIDEHTSFLPHTIIIFMSFFHQTAYDLTGNMIFSSLFLFLTVLFLLSSKYECLAQLGEHFLDVEGVMGSSPLALTIQKVLEIGLFLMF